MEDLHKAFCSLSPTIDAAFGEDSTVGERGPELRSRLVDVVPEKHFTASPDQLPSLRDEKTFTPTRSPRSARH